MIAADGLPVGYFPANDIAAYRLLVSRVPAGCTVVEVGTWLGRSLASIAPDCRDRGLLLYAVDHWSRDPGAYMPKVSFDPLAAFIANMASLGLAGAFHAIQGDSTAAAERFEDGEIDLVFLDADHEYESVRRDIAAWRPKVKAGGVLAGHDFPTYEGVVRAVRETFPAVRRCGTAIWWMPL